MRVLVVDDVVSARRVIRDVLEEDPDITVVGEAGNGEEAVALALRLRPDVITMDVLMPVLDGYAATARIMSQCPTPIVAVTSLSLEDGTVLARMFTSGAVDVMSKAFSREPEKWARMRRELVLRVKTAAQAKVRGIPEAQPASGAAGPHGVRASAPPNVGVAGGGRDASVRQARIIVIAASTGGPVALSALLGALPADLGVPVLVVQHIAEGFTGWLAEWLDGSVGLTVKVAEDSERARPGHVYVAPHDRHLLVLPHYIIRLNQALPVQSLRPSADVLFRAAARAFGPDVVGVVLTGMGHDGTDGARAIKDAGGRVLVQSEETSVIFGMPRAAIEAGVADEALSLEKIARRLVALCGREGAP